LPENESQIWKKKKCLKNCFRSLKLMSPLKNNYLTLRSKVKVPQRSLRYATHRLMVMHPHTKYHCTIWKDKKSYGPDKLRWEEAEEVEEKIRLKQYVSLRSKGRHNKINGTVKSLLFVGYQFPWVGWSTKLRIQRTMKLGKQFDIDIYSHVVLEW
jgi:hypothetical protein